jgi:hypothetical protein
MKRTLAIVILGLAPCFIWGQSETKSTLGTCRAEYARWYPNESFRGEPETMLGLDLYQQTANLYTQELFNRSNELSQCSLTADENPVGENRAFERLAVAYLLVAQKRVVAFVEAAPSADRKGKKPKSELDDIYDLEVVTVGCVSTPCRRYSSLEPYGPQAAH